MPARKQSLTVKGRPAKDTPRPKAARKRRQDRPLTDGQVLFVERYMIHRNASRAYRESHPECSPSTAYAEGPALRKDPRIALEIKARLAKVVSRYRHSAKRTLDELSYMAHSNLLDFFTEDGALIDPKDLPIEAGAALKKLEFVQLYAAGEEGEGKKAVGHTAKLELQDKVGALRLLGNHYGVFKERVELTASADFADLLREARERASANR